LVDHDAVGITAVRDATRDLVGRVVREGREAEAVLLEACLAARALAARPDHAADCCQVTLFEQTDRAADLHHSADNLVPRYARVHGRHHAFPLIARLVQIGVTDATIENLELYVLGLRRPSRKTERRERRRRTRRGKSFRHNRPLFQRVVVGDRNRLCCLSHLRVSFKRPAQTLGRRGHSRTSKTRQCTCRTRHDAPRDLCGPNSRRQASTAAERFGQPRLRVIKSCRWLPTPHDATIRSKASKHVPPNEAYDPYRFNPLIAHPIIRPQIQPLGVADGSRRVYFLPSRRLLLLRATNGLYHDLANAHASTGKRNPFRTAFGYVFQEYVGTLLRAAFGPDRVLREWVYEDVDTPDWVVLEGEKAVVIEVKQSGQFLISKMWGHLDDLRKDLSKTLGHAMGQLHRFDRALSRKVAGLEPLANVRKVERLIVSYDEVSWANWVLRDVAREVSGVPQDFFAHIASVHDFERLLANCWEGSLFDLLERKRGSEDQAEMDFHDWLSKEVDPEGKAENPLLEARHNEFLNAWGIQSSANHRQP
jgi:hypothetical protein